MKTAPFGDVDPAEWNRVYEQSAQAWLFHSADWIRIEQDFSGVENHSFALLEGGHVVGIQPLYARSLGLGPFVERLVDSGLHRHTELALDPALPLTERASARAVAMAEIRRLADELDVDRIQLNEQNLTPARFAQPPALPWWVVEHGFELGIQYGPSGIAPAPGMSTAVADQIVALDPPVEAMLARLSKSARQGVRRALAAGLTFHEGGADSPGRYSDLALESARRTAQALPTEGYYEAIWSSLSGSGRCFCFLAELGALTAAAVLILVDKGSAHFLAGASDPEALSHAPNDFLQWQTILWAKERGLRQYRLGPVFPSLPAEWPVARVSWFKGKFGGLSIPIVEGSYFRRPERYLELGREQLARRCEPRSDD